MFKEGDIVVCKNVPITVNGIVVHSCSDIIIGNSYVIVKVGDSVSDYLSNKYKKINLVMLQINGEKGSCWYWSDYFYNKEELRKIKIDKICSKKVIK